MSIIATFAILTGLLIIPLLMIALYVHRDAAARGMNATLWTLIALAAPALTGFIIYLLVRGDTPGSRCPVCHAPVAADWKCCPRCTAPLPAEAPLSTPEKKDRSLGAILTLVCLVPLVMLAVLALSYAAPGVGVGITTLHADEYLQEMANPEIDAWLKACQNGDEAVYILQHGQQLADGRQRNRYLVYLPGLRWDTDVNTRQSTGLFGATIDLELSGGSGSADAVMLVSCTGESAAPRLRISINGRRLPYRYTHVDYPLGLTDAHH